MIKKILVSLFAGLFLLIVSVIINTGTVGFAYAGSEDSYSFTITGGGTNKSAYFYRGEEHSFSLPYNPDQSY